MTATEPATHISLPELIRLQADARALKLPAARPVRSRQAGLQRSPRRGRGMAFAEVRQYQPGDDIRSIDWRVTARRQSPHTKLYEEERERPVLLLCDLGPSLFFASTGAYKQVRCAQLTGILAWLALWSGDQVGGIVFNGSELSVQRPARRKKSVLRLLDTVAQQQRVSRNDPDLQGGSETTCDLDTALQEARRVAHTGSRIFVISDFLNITADTSRLLGSLARHNTVSALRVIDPLELKLPDSGRFAIAGEDGPVWFDSSNPRFQQAYAEKVRQHTEAVGECFRTAGVQPASVMTGDQPALILQTLLGPRGHIG
ncbi:DUF58 domain-containing protein [Marinobacter panjinensis]|uniref:DUF58 domain-containing protein n=1 Tax=Marinobacter panjinensis TaxID=2576384 RepID=A0A4U6R2A1_9GAMM|nr:DUF58 domain-containing protein [Marinobacter panjinensis]MCR8913838.1 DUF58 domain-containing protein [Marinobacter panjinensis]TKV67523.1 DUF58 domain-containing protein [Marinobacter panjinensis]